MISVSVAGPPASCGRVVCRRSWRYNALSTGGAGAGDVIVDQTTGCIAGRYDLMFEPRSGASEGATGELAGWFSVPLP